MREYARRQTVLLLRKLASEIRRAANAADPDAIHDLRVAIRRLSRCLRAFSQFYPGRSWKKARSMLSELLHTAGAVRDHDIALELLAKARISRRSPVVSKLRAERAEAHDVLVGELRRWRDRRFAGQWLGLLGLKS
jgi:CHAD domain-containing protein